MNKFFKRAAAVVTALAVMAAAVVFDVPEKIMAIAKAATVTETAEETQDCDGTHSGMSAWTDENDLPTSGNYYLDTDVILSSCSYISTGSLTLCLNGHTITAASGKQIFSISDSLTLCDCSSGKTGKLIGGGDVEFSGGAVDVTGSGTFTMNGGTISGNTAGTGGGVYVRSGASFIMNGGTISNNITKSNGGGVYSSGIFTMNGGTISDNTTNSNAGGGVFVAGSGIFIMKGGMISSNTADIRGGGVYVNGGTFTMSGGIISGNTTAGEEMEGGNGGGVYIGNSGTFMMNGGTISNNTTFGEMEGGKGGGVCVRDGCTFTMNGGTISNNTASQSGGGVYVGGTFNMNDGTISNNIANGTGGGLYLYGSVFEMKGGTISGNTATTTCGGVFITALSDGKTTTINGKVNISGNTLNDSPSNLYRNCSYGDRGVVTIGSSFDAASRIGVTVPRDLSNCTVTKDVTTGSATDISACFIPDDDGQISLFKDGKVKFSGAHTWGEWQTTIPATCKAEGTKEHSCTNSGCNAKETEIIDKIAHNYENGKCKVCNAVDPDHTHTGGKATCTEKAVCEICEQEYGELAEHIYGDWSVTENPSLTATGTAKHTCENDSSHTETATVPKLSDTSVWTKQTDKHVEPTEESTGKDVYTSEYGEVTVTLPKKEHTHELTYVPEVPATETKEGTKEHWHCDGCGKDFEDEDGTKEVTADDLKIGKIQTEVQAPVNVPKPEIATPKEELIAAALTEDDQKKVDEGTDIKIILKVEDATSTVSAEGKGNVETAINGLENYTLGQYLDVTLLKIIGEEREQKITETNAPIKVTFEIPESLRGKAEYSVIRVHDGTAAILPDLDSDPNTVTIETDKFSTYALTYQEKATSDPSESDPSGGNTGGGNSGSSSDPSTSAPSASDNSDDTSSDDNPSRDDSSDTTSSGNGTSTGESGTNSSSGTSSSDENNHVPSESNPFEDNGNPSTGIAISFVPLAAVFAVLPLTIKRRRK